MSLPPPSLDRRRLLLYVLPACWVLALLARSPLASSQFLCCPMGVQPEDVAVVVAPTHPADDLSEVGEQPFSAESVSEEGVVSVLPLTPTLTPIPPHL